MRPILVIQQDDKDASLGVREGLGDSSGALVLGVPALSFWSIPGIDAIYLTLPEAERWGAVPLEPFQCEVLQTPAEPARQGFPPFAVVGMTVPEGTATEGPSILTRMIKAGFFAVELFNAKSNAFQIRSLGILRIGRFAPALCPIEIGRLLREILKK